MAKNFDICRVGETEWMARNLRETDNGEGIYYNPDTDEYYYTQKAALRIAASLEGWRLPTLEESRSLVQSINEDSGRMGLGRNGYFFDGGFRFVGDAAYVWSTGLADEIRTNYVFQNDACTCTATAWGAHGFSVRLVRE